jgi:DNA-binding MarR family transcriptional regulator
MGSQPLRSRRSASRAQRESLVDALNAIRRIVRALRLASTAAERALGVSGAQLFVLQQLAEGAPEKVGGLSIAELAARTATDPSSVSVVVSRLVERKLVARRVSKVDARRAEVVITAAGLRLLKKTPAPIQAKLIEGLASLPPARLRAVVSGLEAVVAAMGALDGEATMFFEEEAQGRRRRKEP